MDVTNTVRVHPQASSHGEDGEVQTSACSAALVDEALAEGGRREEQQTAERQLDLEYWVHQLADVSAPLQLPTDRPRGVSRFHTIDRVSVKLSTALTRRLSSVARRHQVSLFATLLSAWAVLLGRWSGQEEVLLAARGWSRRRIGLDPTDDRVNHTVALRLAVQEDATVECLFRHVEGTASEADGHGSIPLGRVIAALKRAEDPLVPVLVEFDESVRVAQSRFESSTLVGAALSDATSPFELVVSLSDSRGHLTGTLEYASDLYDQDTIERLVESWKVLLQGMTKHDRRPVARLGMLTAVERERVLHGFNQTISPYVRDRPIHALFEDQVERTPDAVAIEFGQQRVTYRELNSRANQLARYLKEKGAREDQLVGIYIERSVNMVVGLLGILKAGAAYVPLDPNYPHERLAYMLDDAAPAVVLTHAILKAGLPPTSAELIALDEQWSEIGKHAQLDLDPCEVERPAQNRVYVIYTSGSTGRPKGTEMAHGAMANLIEWHRATFPENEGKRVLQFAALSFDVAFQETFTTLCTGGTLVLIDEWVRRDARALMQLLIERSIERLFLPPLVLQGLADLCSNTGMVAARLQDVITAGEQLRISRETRKFFQQHGGCTLHNHYGPTETHVVTSLTLTGDPSGWPVFPSIGRPIANTQIYVLSGQLQPVPIGVVGEIYIGGANLACGYLNRPQLTAQRFIDNPVSAQAGVRLYKTGDLGRWRPDGTLDYVGRSDEQVKIRGFRVELGEIEATLAQHEKVNEVAVLAREDVSGAKALVAYATTMDGHTVGVEDLRAHLVGRLPEYMVPSAFVLMQSLPVTPSGKLDRRRLPAPEATAYVSEQYEPPLGEVEEVLAVVWQELLPVQRVGRHDNFFALGGDSLLVGRMIERLRRSGLAADVRSVYSSATLAEMARALNGAAPQHEILPNSIPPGCEGIAPHMLPLVDLQENHIDRIVQVIPGGAGNIQDVYPLAPLQEGILFHHLLDEQGGDTYVLPTLLSLSSRKTLDEFVLALGEVISRHDVLRTSILWEQLPRPVQVVCRHASLPVKERVVDGDREVMEQLEEWMRPEHQKLDIRRAPLMQLQVAQDPQSMRWYALLQLHHLVCDNESLNTMLTEVSAFLADQAHELPEPVPYRNHVAHSLAQGSTEKAEEFFARKLADIDEPTAPFGVSDVRVDATRIQSAREVLQPVVARRVRELARRLGVSAATLFHAAWALVIAHTSGRDDVVFGSVFLGRMHGDEGTQRALGMFINTLPLRLRLRDATAAEFVKHTQRELIDLLSHDQASLAVAQRSSGVGTAPLFSALLNYFHSASNAEIDHASLAPGISVLARQEWTNYPIVLHVKDAGERFELVMQTDRSIDPQRMTGYVQTAVQSLVEAIEGEPDRRILELSILPEGERHRIIDLFNETQIDYPEQKLIHALYEEQAERTPNAVAVVHEEHTMTYAELNARANQLARYLRMHGVGPDRTVAICLERGPDVVVGLLGVLKAGGAYVPLDPAYPAERLQYMLDDAAPCVLLTQERLRSGLPPISGEVVLVDRDWAEIDRCETENLDPASLPLESHNLAYVIYTSGSTGNPKGVMIEHAGVVNFLRSMQQNPGLSATDCLLAVTTVSFDIAALEIYLPLVSGAKVVLASREAVADAQRLIAMLEEFEVTVLQATPATWHLLLSGGWSGRPNLKALCGGEALTADLAKDLLGRVASLWNLYGPTETTIWSSCRQILAAGETGRVESIGRPIANTQIYILDGRQRVAPVGTVGEIYIGGAGLARGYLNRPDLTSERFVANPFSVDPQARLYKTGDIGRWLTEGIIDYLGRNDHQVKIRGYRIELGEIEAQLRRHEQVNQALVVAREDVVGAKRLVAYVVPRDSASAGETLRVEALREHIRGALPEYMVPSAFVVLTTLPLTANGKLDRRALPAPESAAYASEHYEPPQGTVEEILAGIWQDVLRVEQVGRNDNFFDLGGHSLLAMQAAVRIRSSFSIEMPVKLMFEFPTVMQLSAQVDRLRGARLRERLSDGGDELEELLKMVSSMSESRVQELTQELTIGGRS